MKLLPVNLLFLASILISAHTHALTLKVGVATDSGFFANNDGGTLNGIDVDITRSICLAKGWDCRFGETLFDTIFSEVTGYEVLDDHIDYTRPVTRKWDLVLGALDAKTTRFRFMTFSDPYFSGRHLFYKSTGTPAPELQQPSGFPLPRAGLKIAVQNGSALHKELLMVYGSMPRSDMEIVTFKNMDDLKALLAAGVELVFTFTGASESQKAAELGLEKASGLLGVVDPAVVRGVAVGVSYDAPHANLIAQELSEVIGQMLADCKKNTDCEYNRIIKKNVGELSFDPNPSFIPPVVFR